MRRLEEIEPFGERGAWIRNAILCAVLSNINRGPGQRAVEIDDFMPETMRSRSAPIDEAASANNVLAFFEMIEQSQKAGESADR